MAAIDRKGGQIGGKRRLKTMTKAEPSESERSQLLHGFKECAGCTLEFFKKLAM